MKQETLYGGALIAGSLALLATGALHPTGGELLASREAAEHVGLKNTIVHAIALAGVWSALFGVVGFSRRLSFARADVTAALIAFAMASFAVMVAAIIDGIAIPKLARWYFELDGSVRDGIRGQMYYSGLLASSLSRFYVSAVAVAVLLWSWAVWRTRLDRVLPWVGVAVAVPAVIGQLSGYLQMNVHDVLILAVGQGVWMIWTGVVLMRAPKAGALQT
jgi:hypothetical protein